MEESPLDYVAMACMDLAEAMNEASSEMEKDTLVMNHIKKVWNASTPVEDFKKNLEWVNVSEPLSLQQHCSEKVVVLDFWTYCCVNCQHVLPDLAVLEKLHSVEDGLVIIGVHSAKFHNEKDSANVLAAVRRHSIRHAVVNDAESSSWRALGIHCWPTLLVLGTQNKPLFVVVGEGHREDLLRFVSASLRHFTKLSPKPLPVCPDQHLLPFSEDSLLFPTKLALNPFYKGKSEEAFVAISDSGNHRVVLVTYAGNIVRVIGSGRPGFKDGKISEAQMDSPQGLCWLSSSVLVVCDTGNHALRTVHLDEDSVELLCGTGEQAEPQDLGGKCLGLQALSSPWDVVLYKTPDMDMSVRAAPLVPPVVAAPSSGAPPPPPPLPTLAKAEKEKESDEIRRVLLIATAGNHQIWALFLDTTIWWKYKKYKEGTCVCIAGSGAEGCQNSSVPSSAAFAQPSGLTLRTGSNADVFIADSESSSIRRLSLATGAVSSLAGGDKNPTDLFAFGDQNGIGYEAKFQHPLAVAYSEHQKLLYVADTYNHKIKQIDIATQKVSTLHPTTIETSEPVRFNEPSGLALSSDSKYLYIADTNNHSVKIMNIAKKVCQEFNVRINAPVYAEPENLILYKNDLFVNRKCGSLIIFFNVSLDDAGCKNVRFTPGAPQNWNVCVRDEAAADVTTEEFEFVRSQPTGSRLPGRVELKLRQRTDKTHYKIYLCFRTSLCDKDVCFSHSFTVRSKILVRDSVKMVESYKLTCKVNPTNKAGGNTEA